MTRISEETGHYVEMVGCPCECIEDRALAIHRAIQDAGREDRRAGSGKRKRGAAAFRKPHLRLSHGSEMVRKSMNNYDRQTIRRKSFTENIEIIFSGC